MFKDLSVRASTPEYWSNLFMASRSISLNSLYSKLFDVNRRLFDPNWHNIRREIRPGGRILDAGCGMGQWVNFLRSQGYEAIGLDYSQDMVNALKTRFPSGNWVQGDIHKLPFPDNYVDGIVSWGVIEHNEDGPLVALQEFYRILKPGGTILVTVPYDSPMLRRWSEIVRSKEKAENPSADSTFYQYFMTEADLLGYMNEAKFRSRVVPSSRDYSFSFPKLSMRMQPLGHLGHALITFALKPVLYSSNRYISMILGIGKKPE